MHNTLKHLLPGPGNSLDLSKRIKVVPRKGEPFHAKFVQVNGDNAIMRVIDTGEIKSISLNTSARRCNGASAP